MYRKCVLNEKQKQKNRHSLIIFNLRQNLCVISERLFTNNIFSREFQLERMQELQANMTRTKWHFVKYDGNNRRILIKRLAEKQVVHCFPRRIIIAVKVQTSQWERLKVWHMFHRINSIVFSLLFLRNYQDSFIVLRLFNFTQTFKKIIYITPSARSKGA